MLRYKSNKFYNIKPLYSFQKTPLPNGRPFHWASSKLICFHNENLSASSHPFIHLNRDILSEDPFLFPPTKESTASPPVTRCLRTIPVLTPQHRSTFSSQLARRPTSEAAALPRRAFYGGKIDVIWIKGEPSPAQTR